MIIGLVAVFKAVVGLPAGMSPAALLGLVIGDRLEHRIPQAKFLLFIDGILLTLGVLLLVGFLRR